MTAEEHACTCICDKRAHLTGKSSGYSILPGHCDLCRSALTLLEALQAIMEFSHKANKDATGLGTQITTTIGMMALNAIKLVKGETS